MEKFNPPDLQVQVEQLKIPKKVVFIDVNGTLFSDDSQDGYIPQADIEAFKETVICAQQENISVGLCSDSPLPQLKQLSEKLGLQGPIIAENGNIIYNNNQTCIINNLPGISDYKQEIKGLADGLGYVSLQDCIAPELGGSVITTDSLQWAFGANREASITVFGPARLITTLGLGFRDKTGISLDCSPEYGFFAIHPGNDFTQNKGKTLKTLARFGHQVLMIGNSKSDWVDPSSGVTCGFVGQARITPDIASQATYISQQPTIHGVIDILENVLQKR